MEAWDQYADDVEDGKVISGNEIKLAVKRYLRLKGKYTFDEKKVLEKIKFIGMLRHFTGRFAGKSFKLEPWQQFIIASIYGFYREDVHNFLSKIT